MGILSPLCAATGPGNTIYAFAQAPGYGNLTKLGQQYVIAKSTDTAAFTEMIWSTVATISASAFSDFKNPDACIVDDQGVVTIFGETRRAVQSRLRTAPMVIRYDPSAPSVVGMESTGPGGWMNITVSKYYESGKSSGRDSKAFYVRDTIDGAQKLIHLTSERFGTRDLQFGIVNEKSKTLSSVANWTMWQSEDFIPVRSIAYSNNELYLYMSRSTLSKLSVYPLTNLSSTIPPNPRVFDVNSTTDICSASHYHYSGVWGNSYHLMCAFNIHWGRYNSTLYTVNNSTGSGSLASSGITIPMSLEYTNTFLPVAATPDYAFMLNEYPRTYALEVSGATTGTVWEKDLVVPEAFGEDPNAKPKITTGAIVGIILGILVLVVIVVYCFRKRLASKKKRAVEVEMNQMDPERHNQVEVKGSRE